MNIFVLDTDLEQCARYHVDRHVVKMLLEYTQLLSTAVASTGVDTRYKPTHVNHPCAIWVRESLENWRWLRDLTCFLHDEYQFRYGNKIHKSFLAMLELPEPDLIDVGLTPFAQAMPDQYRSNNPVKAYREYYRHDKTHLFQWTGRPRPEWLK
jgi:hypothetical protein